MIGNDHRFRQRLLTWYSQNKRELPWRVAVGLPDAYRVMISEFMLQQTQVKMALPFFRNFIGHFPDVRSLANSDEQAVLRLWQGLGYYSRARNLRRAAMQIVDQFNGIVPASLEELRSLPGIGRYTAGAIASLAYGLPAPIVDANVARVIARLELIREDPRQKKVLERLWERAGSLVRGDRPGDFNSAMMELGSTICLPRAPDCVNCPVKMHCRAFAAGVQRQIPPVKRKQQIPLEKRLTLCIEKDGKWLIEQRPASGRWASLWQFTTFVGAVNGWNKRSGTKLGVVHHALTHRKYEFTAYRCGHVKLPMSENRRWVAPGELPQYPMSKPQREIARMLKLAS